MNVTLSSKFMNSVYDDDDSSRKPTDFMTSGVKQLMTIKKTSFETELKVKGYDNFQDAYGSVGKMAERGGRVSRAGKKKKSVDGQASAKFR